jgi:hypothetical protein
MHCRRLPSIRPVVSMKKPFRYITAEETKKPGYLKARMVMYRKQVEEQKQREQQVKDEAALKVRKIGRDPK